MDVPSLPSFPESIDHDEPDDDALPELRALAYLGLGLVWFLAFGSMAIIAPVIWFFFGLLAGL